MRDSVEPCLVLSLFMGWASKSSIICTKNASNLEKAPETGRPSRSDSSFGIVKNSIDFLAVAKLSISCGFRRFFRSFKSLSRLLVHKDDKEIDEGEMEIGFPTDVKHLTHIGPNGTAMSINQNIVVRSWENLSVSLVQVELAMAAQAESISQPVICSS
ncbi:CRIB domain-containing protein [Drosera capensis]